ncbi:sulfatase-like hydrolase/transferase [Flammeovirga kamogawensis]|uniref:Sulfatase-like hydrolase/transferase n=1 Tax=Flammeovirga kamogawensis TaxID=373891 RepID=A0ABX8H1H9_9BACT|nr:sulfatase-like hydrolase/transferase [Flammeovirga kamogawensis]MBB6462375.1 arylsulfatase A-like enzyme [Flammeovirga kamogawensis]QWG09488.1 sulfatase-like hydrolase/transferase [Flammeovirga kamogawensis]TRX65004.1 sulfatase-like hydrolase/transferase [Flammeovirga kamogawensis]
MKKLILSIIIFSAAWSLGHAQEKKNVLFIAIDDLKPTIGSFGDDFAITPNIDRLADEGTVFLNNHCQQAVCGPSRASLLTGLRPDVVRVWDLKTKIRSQRPNVVMLPQYFKENGYTTYGVGKIFDPRSVDKQQDEVSWTAYTLPNQLKYPEGYREPSLSYYQDPANRARIKELRKEAIEKGIKKNKINKWIQTQFKPAYEKADVPDEAYIDGAITEQGIQYIKDLENSDKPFFLAVGYKRPHLPFAAPSKYWEMYQEKEVPLAQFQQKVVGGYDKAYHNSSELKGYKTEGIDISEQDGLAVVSEDGQRKLIHGYYAATSYVDALVGRLLTQLKESNLDKNTIIILWGDHGWHLGDHRLWNKHSNFEQATRSPMVIVDPSQKTVRRVESVTEFVDIYPTLTDLAGIATPTSLSGTSLRPLLDGSEKVIKKYAVTQIARGQINGYSLKSENLRYTVWYNNAPRKKASLSDSKRMAEELYDYTEDPLETRNLANDKAYKQQLEMMRALFLDFFTNDRNYKEFSIGKAESNSDNWLEEANARIEKNRKGEVLLTVLDKKGKPFEGEVKIQQTSHQFRFGGIINSSLFAGEKAQIYKDAFVPMFEHTGFENAFKIKHKRLFDKYGKDITTWLTKEDISLRGHALVWEKKKNMTKDLQKELTVKDTTKVIAGLEAYTKYGLQDYDAIEWDVLNEPRECHDVQDITTQNSWAHWFFYADKVRKDPSVKFYLNENKVISSPYKTAERNIKFHKNVIDGILAEGAPLEALGFQSRMKQHIHPADLYDRLNTFAAYGLPMLGTEFEIVDSGYQKFTEQDRKDITKEVMTIYYSHPQVEGLYVWTPFGKDRKAFFDLDGNPRAEAKVWKAQLDEWTTSLSTKSDSKGNVKFRGHKGTYTAEITQKGKTYIQYFEVLEASNDIKLKLTELIN